MPVYQYKCSKCNHKFELVQSFDADPSACCPECCNGAKRLFVPVPIIFKGSGFYVTDHRKGSNGDVEKTSEVKPEAKTEAKPEAKVTEEKEKTVTNGVKESEKL